MNFEKLTFRQQNLLVLASGVVIGAGIVMMGRKIKSVKIPKMKLHIYDHCPFCIRVELVLGWKGIPYERVVYGYGDTIGDKDKGTYYGGVTLTGKKQLPVLEVKGKPFMPESGDIISYLESLQGPGKVLLPPLSGRKDLKDFFESKGKFKQTAQILTRPAKIKMVHLKDWARSEDIEYAKAKYTQQGFDYNAAEAAKEENIATMNGLLEQLNDMVYSTEALGEGPCSLTWDDVVYLPQLRTVSMVQGLAWPNKLRSYVENTLNKGNVASYF